MKKIVKQSIYLLLLLALCSCQNEDENPLSNNDGEITETGYEQYGIPFNNIPDTKDITMYEVNLRAFSSGGDIQGVIDDLDHIESLGINVIWLMPIHPNGQINSVNSPYSVKDYKAVSSEYGNLEDLRNLTDEAHSRGIAVIMDWVANHTSWDNEWIDNTSWYTQDNDGNIIHPSGTNWLDVADLNYDNNSMREAMIDAMHYWIYEANIDGFRCDYADGVPFDFWQQAFQSMDTIPNREFILFAEGTRNDHFAAGFDLNFGWEFYGAVKDVFNGQSANNIFTAHNNEYNNLPANKHWIRFTTNHDESAWDATPINLFNGENGALAASVITIFTGGVPLIYSSQEVGTANNVPFFSNSTINWNATPDLLDSYKEILQYYSNSQIAKTGQNTIYQDNDIVCFKKMLGNEEIVIITNIRNATINYTIPSELENTVWTDMMTQNTTSLNCQITLAPYQFYILE